MWLNGELERIWKKTVWVHFKGTFQHFHGRTEKICEEVIDNSRSQEPDIGETKLLGYETWRLSVIFIVHANVIVNSMKQHKFLLCLPVADRRS